MGHGNDDPFLVWVGSGLAGMISRDLWSVFAKLTGLAKFYVWQIGADVFIEPAQVKTFLGTIVGFMTDIVTGSLMGLVFGMFIEWRGPKYTLLKAWGAGLAAWLFLFGFVFHTLPQTHTTAPKDALSAISSFIGHSIFGLGMGLAYLKFAKVNARSWKGKR